MKNIAIIGAGTMGVGIAHVFAQHKYKVQLIDKNEILLKKGLETIAFNLDRLITKQKITSKLKTQTLLNINCTTNLKEAVKNADLVIEAITEQLEQKLALFKLLDTYTTQKAILATNTSSISITKIASVITKPERVIGMHFMNPVPIMPLVEVIKGYNTSPEVVNTITKIAQNINKVTVQVNDYPGFVANRILMPMINEAIEALYTGVTGVKEIDAVMTLGMAHPMGPLQLADFIGLDVCLSILNIMHSTFKSPKYVACPLLVKMVEAGKLGVKSKEGFYNYTQHKKAEQVAKQFT